MLRRVQLLGNVGGRANLLRIYFAGTYTNPNLQSQLSAWRNSNFSTKLPLIPIRATQGWLGSAERRYATFTTDTRSSADDIDSDLITENKFARTILANSKKCPKTIGLPLETIESVSDKDVEEILSRDWKSSGLDDVLKAFKTLSCHASLNSMSLCQDKHGAIMHALSINLEDGNDEQLQLLFQCLLLWTDIRWEKCPGYTDLWMEMNRSCMRLLPSWSYDKALLFADYFYQLRLSRKAKYIPAMMRILGNKPKRMNVIHFLHFIFFLNVSRKPPINMYEIEYYLDKVLEEFTANELGIVAMAFFKTETSFRDEKLVSRMHMKVLTEWNEIQDISLSSIMKMTRYSTGLKELEIFRKVLNSVKTRVSDLSLPCLAHVAHAAGFVQCHDAELMQMIIERFEKDIDKARIKDIERICWALMIFNYNSETALYHAAIENMRNATRKDEIERFPRTVPMTLTHLSHAGVFPIDLIKKSLDPTFLMQMCNNNIYKIGWNIFALENNVKIEIPEYDGPFLKDNVREFLAKKYMANVVRSMEKSQNADKFIVEVAHMCKLTLESETAIHIVQVLPHFMKPDIIICLDEANNPIAPEPILSKMPIGTIKYVPREVSNLKWIALIMGTQNQVLRETNEYIGLLSCKIRQLKKIGYTPVVIPITEWQSLSRLDAKQSYLRNILSLAPDRKVSAKGF